MLHIAIPSGLVPELRAIYKADPTMFNGDLTGFGLRRLHWGSANPYFVWQPPHHQQVPERTVCLKIHVSEPGLAGYEHRVLDYITKRLTPAEPRVLWQDFDGALPVTALLLALGEPVSHLRPVPSRLVLSQILTVLQHIREIPPGPFAAAGRSGTSEDRVRVIVDRWHAELQQSSADPLSVDALLALRTWLDGDDPAELTRPARLVLSPGNFDLRQWLWDSLTNTVRLLDWESAGCSTAHWDAADLIEHPNSRQVSDDDWISLLPGLGVHDSDGRRGFLAAQRLVALYWLSVRWSSRQEHPDLFVNQRDRVRVLMKEPFVSQQP